MNYSEHILRITEALKEARTAAAFNKEIYSKAGNVLKNEFLFFIKPELTLDDPKIELDNILKLIFKKVEEFKFNIKSIRVINADYLKKHKIINQHYGVIDQVSENCRKYISEEAKSTFKAIFGESFDDANVYGSKELLDKFAFLSPTSLSFAWQNGSIKKLSGGTYAQKHKFDGKTIYIINGFHPRQLEYFTTNGRCIVVMTLESNVDWNIARSKFIGKTNAQEADLGSIRKELALRKNELGLINIDSTWNGVHLSAGPIESLVELIRYNSNFETGNKLHLSEYAFGKKLIKYFGEQKSTDILNNPTISREDKNVSIFDLTEEMNSEDCIRILKEVVN